MKARFVLIGVACAMLACVSPVQAVTIETVTVGNPGNAGEWSGQSYGGQGPDRICGAVDYTYIIGKFEVTAGQYADFLNAVAATDTHSLYSQNMDNWDDGCQITRNGISGSYMYDLSGRPSGTESDWVNRPVNIITWGRAARFVNWLHNGQPTGAQDLTTTEDGSYFLNGATTDAQIMAVSRELDATWVIPSEDEWYKAAYHKNDGVTGNYFDYPTGTDATPNNNLTDPDPGNNATLYNGSYTIGSPYYRTEVGAHENSESPYGTFDQAGNVLEWNEAIIASSRANRAGHFLGGGSGANAAHRYANSPSLEHVALGFRVAQVPEPATLGLLLLGGLLLFKARCKS